MGAAQAQNRPTKKQQELLSFIDGFIKGNGYGPSYREVMRALGYKSVSTVATHIDSLIAKGCIVKHTYSARSLEVVTPDTMRAEAEAIDSMAAIRRLLEQLKTDDDRADDVAALERTLVLLAESSKPHAKN